MPEIEAIEKEYEEILQKLSDPGLISDWKKSDEAKVSSSPFANARETGDEAKVSSSPFANARVFEELLKRKNDREE